MKVIPAILNCKFIRNSFKFHSNLLFKTNKTKFSPSFFRETILHWKEHLAIRAEISSCILSQYLWCNESIQKDKALLHFLQLSEENINYVSQLLSNNRFIRKWHEFKREYNPLENSYFQWIQLIDSLAERWQLIIKGNYINANSFIIHNHHSIKGSKVATLDKLTSTELYSILISKFEINILLIFSLKICLMTIILTGQQSICYHVLLHIITICNLFNLNNVLFNKKLHTLKNYANTAWCSTNRTYQSQQKYAIRIIFHKSKFAHTQPLFKENNTLNIYQLNIFNSKRFP